ncbi:MAG: hypothetical protein GX259_10305 [Bacteroidales bacterium]|nr:hypothetical protein [Bacteroidales bacterium]
MKIRLQIIILLLFINYSFVYCQEIKTKDNNIKASTLSLFGVLKLQYEKTHNNNLSFGFGTSCHWLVHKGIKFEPTFRYYFKHHAPTGWYIEQKFAIGYFYTIEEFEKEHCIYDANNKLKEYRLEYYHKKLPFYTHGASLKFGIQKFCGKKKRFVFDYNFGFQYFPYRYSGGNDDAEYYDAFGNKNVITVSSSQGIPANEIYWYMFGAGSIIYSNISIGYNF